MRKCIKLMMLQKFSFHLKKGKKEQRTCGCISIEKQIQHRNSFQLQPHFSCSVMLLSVFNGCIIMKQHRMHTFDNEKVFFLNFLSVEEVGNGVHVCILNIFGMISWRKERKII